MTYQETIAWMFGKLPMYQQKGASAYKGKLDNSIMLAMHLQHPEKKFESIHVGGTNGKGSSSHMLASVLQDAGYKTGLYTSPHLKDFRERIRVDGKKIEEDFIIEFIAQNRSFLEAYALSFFEMTVGMAFAYFAAQEVDIAVVEVGMGGRLDATNIIRPKVALITNIAYDHTHVLGYTLEEIAYEKAGIIKPGVPIVVSEYQEESFPIFETVARQRNAALVLAEKMEMEAYNTDLLGDYQAKNIKGVIATLRQLKHMDIREPAIQSGLLKVAENTNLQGRWQKLCDSPYTVCDIAHNAAGLAMVFRQIFQQEFEKLHVVIGMVNDKDINGMFSVFPKSAIYYFCSPDVPRGLAAVALKEKAQALGFEGDTYASVSEAYHVALQNAAPNDFLYVGGSAFVVAEVL